MPDSSTASRRQFVGDIGLAALLAPIGLRRSTVGPGAHRARPDDAGQGEWDLSWVKRIETATDRAVFDWGTMGDPSDPIVVEIAARYLDNCAAVYRKTAPRPTVVLNIRSSATAAALMDGAWERFGLGGDAGVLDPDTKESARRNPFWRRAKDAPAGMPDLAELMDRGAIALVCDFALGHIAGRVARRTGRDQGEVQAELRSSCVPGSFVVPSGIFGLARAQNAGCAFVRM
jgi:hypothetical protein